jgi:hypothetical protein
MKRKHLVRGRMGGMKMVFKPLISPQFDLTLLLITGLVCIVDGMFCWEGSMRVIALLFAAVSFAYAFISLGQLRKEREKK